MKENTFKVFASHLIGKYDNLIKWADSDQTIANRNCPEQLYAKLCMAFEKGFITPIQFIKAKLSIFLSVTSPKERELFQPWVERIAKYLEEGTVPPEQVRYGIPEELLSEEYKKFHENYLGLTWAGRWALEGARKGDKDAEIFYRKAIAATVLRWVPADDGDIMWTKNFLDFQTELSEEEDRERERKFCEALVSEGQRLGLSL